MTGWVCQWNPFWIPVDDDSFKKAYVEDWVFQVTDTSDLSLSGGQGDVVPAPCGESHQEILVEIHKVVADLRDAFERIQTSSSQASVLFSITYAEEAQHLQLEPWAQAWKGRRFGETNCRKVAPHYRTRSF